MWAGPEWKPFYGVGCWYCPWERPIVKLGHSAVCFTCLCRAFPEWPDEQVSDWLIRQAEKAALPRRRETGRQLVLEFA